MSAASIYFQSGQVVFDNNGAVAPGAKLYFYDGETTTPRDTFSDSDLTAGRTHPVVADGYGRIPVVYLDYGSFDVKVTTSGGTQLFYHTNIANPAPFDDTTTFDTTAFLTTGEIFSRLENGTRPGAVRLNGRTLGNTSSGATEHAAADAVNLFAVIYNACSNTQAPVSGGRGANAAEDFAANKRITLPDWRACGPVGFDDMGNTAASLLGSAPVVLGSTILAGSILGANTHTILTAHLPVTTPAGTLSTSAVTGTAAAQTFTGTNATITATGTNSSSALTGGTTASISRFPTGAGGGGNDFLTTAATGSTTTYGVTGTAAAQTFTGSGVSYTPAGTNASSAITATAAAQTFTGTPFGSGTAHNILARSGLCTWFIKL